MVSLEALVDVDVAAAAAGCDGLMTDAVAGTEPKEALVRRTIEEICHFKMKQERTNL